jgi:hypothetical protein
VQNTTFKHAADTNNVWLMLVAGGILILLGIYQYLSVYVSINDPSVHRIYMESIVAIALFCLTGVYCIYMAIKKVPLLLIEAGNKKYKLSLGDSIKKQRKENLKAYLTGKLSVRFYDEL